MTNRKGFDKLLFLVMLGLIILGLLMIFSTTTYNAAISGDGDAYSYFRKQILAEVLGIGAFLFVVLAFPYQGIRLLGERKVRLIVVGAAFFSMFLLKTSLAVTAGGATRWVRLGPVNVQPAELVKAAVIVYMAGYIADDPERINRFWGYVNALIIPGILAGQVYVISDNLSSAIIIMGIAVVMLFVSTKEWFRQVLVYVGLTVGALIAVLGIVNGASDPSKLNYRFMRILIWQHPEEYVMDKGYQTVQALYAIGSGGFWGKGIGKSVQKLGIIPEVHNDMIFSVICEELGLMGALLVLILFGILLVRCTGIARNARTSYGKLIVIGVTMQIAIQVVLNIMVVTNTMPNTGVSLPFISYGGSSVAFLLAEMGLVFKVAGEEKA